MRKRAYSSLEIRAYHDSLLIGLQYDFLPQALVLYQQFGDRAIHEDCARRDNGLVGIKKDAVTADNQGDGDELV